MVGGLSGHGVVKVAKRSQQLRSESEEADEFGTQPNHHTQRG